MKKLAKPASVLFTILCVMSLAYMTFNQVDKYFRNDDTSTISFKNLQKQNIRHTPFVSKTMMIQVVFIRLLNSGISTKQKYILMANMYVLKNET